jgi:hypothetical protein
MLAVGAGTVALFLLGVSGCLSGGDVEGVGHRDVALAVGPERDVDAPDLLPAAGDQTVPMLVRSGDGYLAVWRDDREWFGLKSNRGSPPSIPEWPQTYAARIAADGAVLDPLGIPVTQRLEAFVPEDVACSDDGFCLVIGVLDPPAFIPAAVRIADGQVLDPRPVPMGEFIGLWQSIAWDGTEFRLTWTGGGIFTTSVDREGRAGVPIPIAEPGDPDVLTNSRIACQGERCLIMYRRYNLSTFVATIVGRLVDRSGLASPEFSVTDDFQSTSAGTPLPMWDGTRYWITYPTFPEGATRYSALVARIASDGTFLDPGGIEVARDASPALMSHDGNTALLLFSTAANGGSVARVTGDGVLLDPGGVPLFPPRPGTFSTFTCRGEECFSLSEQWSGSERNLYGSRLQGKTVLDPQGIEITRSPPAEMRASAAFSAGRYLAVWRDSRLLAQPPTSALRGAFFSPDTGTSTPIEVGRGSTHGRCAVTTGLVASASSYLAVWADECLFRHSDIYAQVLDADGRDVGPVIAVDATSQPELRPSVASAGDQYLVVYDRTTHLSSIYGRRYSASGAPLDAARFFIAPDASVPAVAFDGTNYLVVYQTRHSSTVQSKDLVVTRVSPAGILLDPWQTRIVQRTPRDEAQSVACGGGMCVVAWRSGTTEIRALRLSLDGTILDPDGFVVGAADGLLPVTAVTYDGEDFLISWRMMKGDVRAALVSREGAVRPPGAFVVAPDTGAPTGLSVASDGAGHRVVLYDRADLSPAYRVRRVRARVIEGPPGSAFAPEE